MFESELYWLRQIYLTWFLGDELTRFSIILVSTPFVTLQSSIMEKPFRLIQEFLGNLYDKSRIVQVLPR